MKTMNDYTVYCTEEQTKRAYKLDAPIDYVTRRIGLTKPKNSVFLGLCENALYNKFLVYPTTQQMIGWLDTKFLHITANMAGWSITVLLKDDTRNIHRENKSTVSLSRKDTELAAIDSALDYLENR